MGPFSKSFYFNLRRDNQKIFYERRNYESVDEKSLSQAMSRKTTKEEFGRKRWVRVLRITFFSQKFEYIKLNEHKNNEYNIRIFFPT